MTLQLDLTKTLRITFISVLEPFLELAVSTLYTLPQRRWLRVSASHHDLHPWWPLVPQFHISLPLLYLTLVWLAEKQQLLNLVVLLLHSVSLSDADECDPRFQEMYASPQYLHHTTRHTTTPRWNFSLQFNFKVLFLQMSWSCLSINLLLFYSLLHIFSKCPFFPVQVTIFSPPTDSPLDLFSLPSSLTIFRSTFQLSCIYSSTYTTTHS